MAELREMRGGAPTSARYSRLEGTDDSIRIKIKTLDNESTWEVEGEGSWTVRQLKDHVRRQPPGAAPPAAPPAARGLPGARGPTRRAAEAAARLAVRGAQNASRPPLSSPPLPGRRVPGGRRAHAAAGAQLKETKDLKEKRIRLILLGRMLEVPAAPAALWSVASARHGPWHAPARSAACLRSRGARTGQKPRALTRFPGLRCVLRPPLHATCPGLAYTKLVWPERRRFCSCGNLRRGGCPFLRLCFAARVLPPRRDACGRAP